MASPPDITLGHVLRHAPARGAEGLDAALIDIAQDLLLRHLHEKGVLEAVAFKGGTALRKLFAGAAGRFSTDLDFSLRRVDSDLPAVLPWLVAETRGLEVGPFRFDTVLRRGRHHVTIGSALGRVPDLTCKLDLGPPSWLPAESRTWVPLPIHARYGGALPALNVVRLEENVAEKVARLNRATPARDVYDLVWIAQHHQRLGRPLDLPLVRRLSVMKNWVDLHGLTSLRHAWKPGHAPVAFDADHWLRQRQASEFDDEEVGLLTAAPPSLQELGRALAAHYRFLSDLGPEERVLARGHGGDRDLLLRMLAGIPETQLPAGTCW